MSVQDERKKKEARINAIQEDLLRRTYANSQWFIENLSFLTEYGFSFVIRKTYDNGWHEAGKDFYYEVQILRNGNHFAIVRAGNAESRCVCTSWQLEPKMRCVEYSTFEDVVKAISKRVRIK